MQADLFGSPQAPAPAGCLGCGQDHADASPVTLVDGTISHSYSEAWRLECEARAILKIQPLVKRQAHLDAIAKRRGEGAADQLRESMLAVWNARMAEKLSA